MPEAESREPSRPPPVPTLEARGLVRRFGPACALAGVDLRLAPGELVLLLGDNGAGKSTLLRVLAGLLRADGGEVRRREGLPPPGYLSHRGGLHRDFAIREALLRIGALHGLGAATVERWIERAGLAAEADRRLGECSRGRAQRAALAAAFLPSPELLLLDEPTTGLDRAGRDLSSGWIAEAVAGGAAVLAATHEPSSFGGVESRRVRLVAGRGVFEERP